MIRNKGFTLIEIIVVLIIIGILVAISLPASFFWIKRSKLAEAFSTINSLKPQLIGCLRAHLGSEGICFPPPANCATNNCIKLIDDASLNFNYLVNNQGDAQVLRIIVFPKPVTLGPDYILIVYPADDTASSCSSEGEFKGVC